MLHSVVCWSIENSFESTPHPSSTVWKFHVDSDRCRAPVIYIAIHVTAANLCPIRRFRVLNTCQMYTLKIGCVLARHPNTPSRAPKARAKKIWRCRCQNMKKIIYVGGKFPVVESYFSAFPPPKIRTFRTKFPTPKLDFQCEKSPPYFLNRDLGGRFPTPISHFPPPSTRGGGNSS